MNLQIYRNAACATFLALGLSALPSPVASQTSKDIDFGFGPDVPHDIKERKPASREYDKELAIWAWQQFVALGWKATYDLTAIPPMAQRGTPDTKWKLSDPTPETVVWETYAHRSELRPWNTPLTGRLFNSLPEYLTEVSAEGRLKQGTDQHGGPASLNLLNNLDEDNEIGSADVYLGADIDPATTPLVLYQAKVNRDEYEYVKAQFPDQQDPKGSLAKAINNNLENIKKYRSYFPPNADGTPNYDICNVPEGDKKNIAITLPCGRIGGAEGAIEIKTAFLYVPQRRLSEFSDFFVRDAIYYTKATNAGGKIEFTYHNAKFALLGIHVIHKTENFPGFIFTSFQHKAIEQMGFHYKLLTPPPPAYGNFNPHGAKAPATTPAGTQVGDLIKIERQDGLTTPIANGPLYPVPEVIIEVNQAAQKQLGKDHSIWANYELIGVQALQTTVYAPVADGTAGPNHFMANFVIESDAFIGNFFGPGFSSTDPVFPTGPRYPDGTQNGANSIYQGKTFNMGGCKGCHGVAATAFGTDSSFLLDFGNNKPVKEPDTILYAKPAQ